MIEKPLLGFSVEETQQIVAMLQNLLNKTNTLIERLDRINDRLDGIHPSIRLEDPVENADSTHALDASYVNSAQNATELDTAVEFIPDSIVVQGAESLVAAPQLATEDSHPAVQCYTKDTRKQHACVNRLTVLDLFAAMVSARLTECGSQHKLWKPGLSSA